MALALAVSLAATGNASTPQANRAQVHGGPAWARILRTLDPSDVRSANPCNRGTVACMQVIIGEMEYRLGQLGRVCDRRSAFADLYLHVTRAVLGQDLGSYVYRLDAAFARLYFRSFDLWQAGDRGPVPPAWQLAYRATEHRQVSALGDMLLGVNAHISADLPFAVLETGVRLPDGSSALAAYTTVNETFSGVQRRVMSEEQRWFDPTLAGMKSALSSTPANTLLEQFVAAWRAEAWRDAVRLVSARDAHERAQVAASIQATAARRAELIIALTSDEGSPAAITQREAYCLAHVGEQTFPSERGAR